MVTSLLNVKTSNYLAVKPFKFSDLTQINTCQ